MVEEREIAEFKRDWLKPVQSAGRVETKSHAPQLAQDTTNADKDLPSAVGTRAADSTPAHCDSPHTVHFGLNLASHSLAVSFSFSVNFILPFVASREEKAR